MSYLVNKNGEQFGPYGLEELAGYVARGSFSISDLCWQDGWDDWKPLSSIISRPPPTPISQAPTYSPAPYYQGGIPASNKSRVAYILLGLFLGWLGIHNFFAVYYGKGIAQLLITLLTGWLILPSLAVIIWVLVEICTVTKDANGVPFS